MTTATAHTLAIKFGRKGRRAGENEFKFDPVRTYGAADSLSFPFAEIRCWLSLVLSPSGLGQ